MEHKPDEVQNLRFAHALAEARIKQLEEENELLKESLHNEIYNREKLQTK